MQTTRRLVFLKLGGSLITDKATAHTARREVLTRLAREISAALQKDPDLSLVLGHGSGSFGHFAAQKYGTYTGVHTSLEWRGFAEVWKEARALNEIVMDALVQAGLPVMAFPASAIAITSKRAVLRCETETLQKALQHDLIPVIQGDVVFDTILGGTILSTEDQFFHLAPRLEPQRILLAGVEPGVWSDYPACKQLFDRIHLNDYTKIAPALGASAGVDVTGGMTQKVSRMLDVIRANPRLEIRIFSGVESNSIERALLGAESGTLLSA
ncbi:isopentenyl phosphate kinase [Longilinea arvoryzae]|uniref:Isopentenyl phosphate kinase n=1 Tax=Longilinea arvoryzae TaxID=360412 RepID=A0A0S7BA96_9CHLR|nr:isopentenyl phosphate kinase [Longilinea arvoryzae]GAP14407.1 isopentenyl phosphate kinase [Longilinea arvoryzae]